MSNEAILRAAVRQALALCRDASDCHLLGRPEDAQVWVRDAAKVLQKALGETAEQ